MQGQIDRKCQNCGKPFPQSKIDIHEAYCSRNIKKCKRCQRMFDIKDEQSHQKEYHSKKQCQFCKVEFEMQEHGLHLQNCNRRPKTCKFCQNSFAIGDLGQHEQVCGSRTKPCSICQRSVLLRDLPDHQIRCQSRREGRGGQVSQDQYRGNRRNEPERILGDRQRQVSTNNIRDNTNKSNSAHKIQKPQKIKPNNIIPPQTIKPAIDPVPVSIRLAIKAKQQRLPLKNKN